MNYVDCISWAPSWTGVQLSLPEFLKQDENLKGRKFGIATMGWTAGFNFRHGQVYSFLHSAQIVSGPHPTSYPMDTGGGAVFPGVMRPGLETDNSPLSIAEIKNDGAMPSLLHMSLWHTA
jgi:hypothetical protein